MSGITKEKRTPREANLYVVDHEDDLKQAINLMKNVHRDALAVAGKKYYSYMYFAALWIIQNHDADVLEEFMSALGAAEVSDDEYDPVLVFRQGMDAEKISRGKAMKKHIFLHHLIRVFNAWLTSTPLRSTTGKAVSSLKTLAKDFPAFLPPLAQPDDGDEAEQAATEPQPPQPDAGEAAVAPAE